LEDEVNFLNVVFLALVHACAVVAVWYLWQVRFSWATVALALSWFFACGISVTGGYHRLFSHRSYACMPALEVCYLFFGASALQNSAMKWSADHRRHHAYTDKDNDPYNIKRGFWWAHIGWVFFKNPPCDKASVPDLAQNPRVALQHRYYFPIAIVAFLFPVAIAALWGDAWGGLLVAGFLRLATQYHSTFCVNSVAHWIGKQPYTLADSSRDSFVTALVTLGEGYHNYHHRFPWDYRNGVRWYQFDPTKWWVAVCAKMHMATSVRRVSKLDIMKAWAEVRAIQRTFTERVS